MRHLWKPPQDVPLDGTPVVFLRAVWWAYSEPPPLTVELGIHVYRRDGCWIHDFADFSHRDYGLDRWHWMHVDEYTDAVNALPTWRDAPTVDGFEAMFLRPMSRPRPLSDYGPRRDRFYTAGSVMRYDPTHRKPHETTQVRTGWRTGGAYNATATGYMDGENVAMQPFRWIARADFEPTPLVMQEPATWSCEYEYLQRQRVARSLARAFCFSNIEKST